MFHPVLCAVQRVPQPRLVHRLQQVIDGIHLERAHSVLVIRGHKRDERHRLPLKLTNDAHAIELRHLPIEERKVRFLFLDHRDGVSTRRRLPDHRHVFERPQQRDEETSRRPFVVCDDDTKTGAHTATCSAG